MRHRRRWVLKPDPLGEPRNPLAIYLLGLCTVIGGLGLFGIFTSGSMATLVPWWIARLWSFFLFFGCGSTLAGMFWPWKAADGLFVKRVGLSMVVFAAVLMSLVLFLLVGKSATLFGCITIVFAVSAGRQWWKVNKRIKEIVEASP